MNISSELQNHWLWQDKPFAKGQAWIDLHMLSAIQQTQIIYKGKVYELIPYQLITSENDLRNRWDWSRTKLRSFLRLLKETSMIKLEPDNSKTFIILLKHFDLQDIKTGIITRHQTR